MLRRCVGKHITFIDVPKMLDSEEASSDDMAGAKRA